MNKRDSEFFEGMRRFDERTLGERVRVPDAGAGLHARLLAVGPGSETVDARTERVVRPSAVSDDRALEILIDRSEPYPRSTEPTSQAHRGRMAQCTLSGLNFCPAYGII
jgi:hypothetical protein